MVVIDVYNQQLSDAFDALRGKLTDMSPVLNAIGQRMETRNDDGSVRMTEFKEYGVKVDGDNPTSVEEANARSMPTRELVKLDDPIAHSVLGWRLGLPFAALNFVILGLAVSSVNPRAGNSTSLMIALFAFIVYYNLMTLGQSWIAVGRSNLWTFLLQLHGGALVCAAVTLAVRHNRWSLRQLWARDPRPSTTPEATV